jgi:predicted TIM-barrel fold metal-dependent hydrolase
VINIVPHASRRSWSLPAPPKSRSAPRGSTNDHVATLARRAPGRVHAWAGLSLIDPDAALAELRRCLDLGVTGIFVAPVLDKAGVADDRFADVFALAAEHHLGMYLHTGQHFRPPPATGHHHVAAPDLPAR